MNVKNKVLRGCGSAAVAFGAASAMLPAQAFADEGSGVAAILPQMDEFIPMLVAFIILWIILAKFGWPLFEGMLGQARDHHQGRSRAVRERSR